MKIQKIVSGVLAVSMLASVGTVSALAADTEAAGISVRVQDQAGTSRDVVFNADKGTP